MDSDLLARYIAGEADEELRARVESWAAASEGNAAELLAMQRTWSLGGDSIADAVFDVDTAWGRLERRMDGIERMPAHTARIRPIWTNWLAAAAVLTGIVFATWLYLRPSTARFAAGEDPVAMDLADGSRVVLSANSRLDSRMGSTRSVRLSGSAYFEVSRDEEHPFVIDAADMEVTVLGTAFEVTAYDTSSLAMVRVRSGRVQVVAGTDTLVLGAGEHARYDRGRHFLERTVAAPAEVWGMRVLQFEGATLEQVAMQLQRIYEVRITWNKEAIGRCVLTAEFDDEPIERIITVVAETFGLHVERTADGFLLDGAGC